MPSTARPNPATRLSFTPEGRHSDPGYSGQYFTEIQGVKSLAIPVYRYGAWGEPGRAGTRARHPEVLGRPHRPCSRHHLGQLPHAVRAPKAHHNPGRPAPGRRIRVHMDGAPGHQPDVHHFLPHRDAAPVLHLLLDFLRPSHEPYLRDDPRLPGAHAGLRVRRVLRKDRRAHPAAWTFWVGEPRHIRDDDLRA